MTRDEFLAQHPEAKSLARWIQFQTDAFEGKGGFAPCLDPQTASARGAAAAVDYALRSDVATYILRHESEEDDEFDSRLTAARYRNHLRRSVGHYMGLLFRREPERPKNFHPLVDAFLADCNGVGKPWQRELEAAALWAVVYSGVGTLVDRPTDDSSPPFASHVHPQAVAHWDRDAVGRWRFAKFLESLTEYTPTGGSRSYQRARIWSPAGFETWELDEGNNAEPVVLDGDRGGYGTHDLGEVPLVWLSFDDPLVGRLFGWTPSDEVGQLCREDYNDRSRQGEIFEKETFSTMKIPVREGDEDKAREIVIGAARSIPVPLEGTKEPGYISPDPRPLDQHGEKLKANDAEGLAAFGFDHLLGASSALSGYAKNLDRQHLISDLMRFARRLIDYERGVLRLVLMWHGIPSARAAEILAGYNVSWGEIEIRDRQEEIIVARDLLALPGLDPWSQEAALRQVRDTCLDMSDDNKIKSNEELAKQRDAMLIGEPTEDEASADTGEPTMPMQPGSQETDTETAPAAPPQ